MTFLDPEAVDLGNIAGYISGFQQEGRSATSALGTFRDLGGSVRTQTWYRAWGEVEAAAAAAGPVSALDPSAVPTLGQYTPWAAGREGLLSHDVTVFFRDQDGEVASMQWSVLSSTPLAPADAVASAMDDFAESTRTTETGRGQTLVGAILSGLYAQTGRGV